MRIGGLKLQLPLVFYCGQLQSMRRSMTEESREQVVKNSLNDSTSKTCWSFAKDSRFKTQPNVCPFVAYNINLSTTSKRKTSFGYGKRTNFVLDNKFTPGPLTYEVSKTKTNDRRGFSFGANREEALSASYIPLGVMKNPGPGEYKSQQKQQRNKGYSMRPKTAHEHTYFLDNKELQMIPGPDRYSAAGTLINTPGSNVLSKFKHLGVPSFETKTAKKPDYRNGNPGPGWYFRSQGCESQSSIARHKSMGKQSRISFIDSVARGSFTPGPGTYKLPTDFGHYKRAVDI